MRALRPGLVLGRFASLGVRRRVVRMTRNAIVGLVRFSLVRMTLFYGRVSLGEQGR